jgi:hypothetical protein
VDRAFRSGIFDLNFLPVFAAPGGRAVLVETINTHLKGHRP